MAQTRLQSWFPGLFGAFLGLSLLKFGNPPILERWVQAPANIYEVVLGSPWPIAWGFGLLGLMAGLGLWVGLRDGSAPSKGLPWLIWLPLLWLAWEGLASTQSLSAQLSWPTWRHFLGCTVCFYLGFFVLARSPNLRSFWVGILCGYALVLVEGWEQHFGGLEATRQYFFREVYPHLKEVPPDYLKKISSNRIFSTLFYPNALAGALLLLMPCCLMVVAQARRYFTFSARCFLVGLVALGGLGCLYWSGSKGGWLLMLFLALIALLQLRFRPSFKLALVVTVLVLGLTGFAWKYASFFRKGATSVSARFDYWQAALKTAVANPWLGTGPGTFLIPYEKIKRPEAEFTRMVHNDYLEQASDSGWLGFVVYSLFIWAGLAQAARRAVPTDRLKEPGTTRADWMTFSVWLGLLGWAFQGLFEFGLYIPALAWPAFTCLGVLLGRTPNPIDKPTAGH